MVPRSFFSEPESVTVTSATAAPVAWVRGCRSGLPSFAAASRAALMRCSADRVAGSVVAGDDGDIAGAAADFWALTFGFGLAVGAAGVGDEDDGTTAGARAPVSLVAVGWSPAR